MLKDVIGKADITIIDRVYDVYNEDGTAEDIDVLDFGNLELPESLQERMKVDLSEHIKKPKAQKLNK